MPSTTLCDCQVLRDSPITLDAATNNREITLGWVMPDDFEHDDGPRRPVLAFRIHPRQDVRYIIHLNGRQILEHSFDQGNNRGMWEVFPASTPFPEGASIPNPVPLRIIMAEGRGTFSDVVMWYQIRRNE
jgi:hypothetical protein